MWTDFKAYFQMLVAGIAKEEGGQTLVEYALIISLVSIGCIVALGLLTGALNGVFTSITGSL
jgi:Flp pilus assembly pilin Flp